MKITDSEELGNIIRNRRKELKYTQAFLSEYTGLSVSFISDVERGKTTVEIGKVILPTLIIFPLHSIYTFKFLIISPLHQY